jgi:hypothetical protein
VRLAGTYSASCPLCPRKRTSFSTIVMSALCQKRTSETLSTCRAILVTGSRLDPLLTGFELWHHLQQGVGPDREFSYKRSVVSEDK